MTDHREAYNQTKEDSPEAKREIYELILKGYTPDEISPIINKKYHGNRKTTYRWIRSVLKAIGDVQKDNDKQRGINVGLAVHRLLNLHDKALEAGKFTTALKALTMAHELQGLVEVSIPKGKSVSKSKDAPKQDEDTDLSQMSTEELKKMLDGEE